MGPTRNSSAQTTRDGNPGTKCLSRDLVHLRNVLNEVDRLKNMPDANLGPSHVCAPQKVHIHMYSYHTYITNEGKKAKRSTFEFSFFASGCLAALAPFTEELF